MAKPKLDKKTIELTYELLKEGHYNEDVAEAIGVSQKTFYNWFNKGEELSLQIEEDEIQNEDLNKFESLQLQFFHTVKRANVEAKMEALKNIRKAGKRNWQAEAWYLERKYRHQFGRVQMIEDSSSSEKQKSSLLERMIAGVDAIAQEDDEE